MDIEKIDGYVTSRISNKKTLDIHFKGRSSITGLFIRANDYDELKSRNFWRVVHISRLKNWLETGDINVARIFNGASFTAITESKS